MTKITHILGGGTFSHVRNHLSLAAPAFGETARRIGDLYNGNTSVQLHLTKMANPLSSIVTNQDVATIVEQLIADPTTHVIYFNVALCDFHGEIQGVPSGKHAERLQSRGELPSIELKLADKLIKRIRSERKDIFLVAFKTTCGASIKDQYIAGLNLLKENSVNLVLANDTLTRQNMIIVPEEAKYCVTTDRNLALQTLVDMTKLRSKLTYTKSTVIEGSDINWSSSDVPESLRTVVDHCIAQGAYKPFRNKTAGHFAVKVNDTTFLTSKRASNFNDLSAVGLVKIESRNKDEVIAYGSKPSVGGMSQRIIFKAHDDVDCIVHFHCPMTTNDIPVRKQYAYECGSHECGQNTSDGLEIVEPGIKAVYLDEHGPNIVFNRNIDPNLVISFIDKHFDLSQKTGGLVA